jgi:hypothetical protein
MRHEVPPPVRPVEPIYEDVASFPDRAHVWRAEDGDIDVFVMESGYHNGPGCSVCDFTFCHHCEPDGYNDMSCLREQADNRNHAARYRYGKALERFAAQMDYWRELSDAAHE